MFRIPSLTAGRLLKYGVLAFASQHFFRKGVQRYSSNRSKIRNPPRNDIDTASRDSFPASDPPSYSGTVGPLS